MKYINIMVIAIIALLILSGCGKNGKTTANAGDKVTVYKSNTCGCCSIYVDYLKGKGKMNVEVVNLDDISKIKTQYNIPSMLQSCHTTVIGNYFIEGHIPLEAIQKLMAEKPDILGIAMPGMPSGSPGMPGSKTGDFLIYSVKKDGTYDTFMTL